MDDDDAEVLLELLQKPLSIEVAHKDLLSVIKVTYLRCEVYILTVLGY